MRLLPGKYIVICKDAGPEKLKSGLEMVRQDKNQPEVGIVFDLYKGNPPKTDDKNKLPFPLKKDDKIVYRKYSDNKVYIGGVAYNFIRFEDIIGKII